MRSEIKPLTGLRGVAAFIVMVYHFGEPFNTLGIDTHFHVPQGYMAVDLFYILSGFVLSYTYAARFRTDFSFPQYRQFLIKRIARIYPAYLVIVFFFLLKMIFNFAGENPLGRYSALDIIGNILMMTGWGLNLKSFIPDSWSVSAEVVCYIVFPILLSVAVLGRAAMTAVVFVACCLAMMAVAFSGLGVKGPLDVVFQDTFYPLLRCLAGFTLGLITFRVTRDAAADRILSRDALFWLMMLVLAGCIAGSAHDLIIFSCFPVLVGILSRGGAGASTLFSNRLVHHLGEISYSLYLIHPMFVSVAVRVTSISPARFGIHLPYFAAAIGGMAITWVVAYFSYCWIELPGKRVVQSLSGRIRPVRAA